MEPNKNNTPISFNNLFNLQPLTNFQLPRQDDDIECCGSSSQDESRSSQAGVMAGHSNGITPKKDLTSSKKKRQNNYSSDEEEDNAYRVHVTEDRYRAMLGEHMLKYKRRGKNSSASPASTPIVAPGPKSGSKGWKIGTDPRAYDVDSKPDYEDNNSPLKLGNYHEEEFVPKYGIRRPLTEPAYLDIRDGITYRIPPTYEKLVPLLNLPGMPDILVEEVYLKGTLDMGSLATMMENDKRFGPRSRTGMGETRAQYESLQSRLKALSNSSEKFDLKVSDVALNSFAIPEGAAGGIRRSILSDGGLLQVYYVKVLEKGDTYEIIERSLPKKQKVVKDPLTIEKEEMEKIGRYWVNMARKDVPKYQKVFVNFHKKQLGDAKRFSEMCQREVKIKVGRSLKLMKGAPIRTRKLARDMLLFWKRIDKEMAEIKKREEKEAAEALKREQELREARRQQQRLNFLLSQTELYSHFMQNKATSQPSDLLPVGDDQPNEQEMTSSSLDGKPKEEEEKEEEEDPEEAELKREALKAAQDAFVKQKKITDAFDTECLKLRQVSDLESPPEDAKIEGSTNIDLLHPSTMPVKSSVQTPAMFKGSLKDYQLKGLQWLVNCYEQGLNGILADEMGLGKTIQAMAFLAHLAEEKNIWGPFLVVAPASVLNNWADEIGRFCPDLKTLPYWGGLQERTVLRKNINPKRLYRRDASFHILITSYQLLVSDEKYFRRVKWQYMVLDEAQAIKSSTSIRWKTLLSFNCRNRLLLTGTPVQNNMAELWSLLHFIMPTLFDSHEQFNEWFSKGIESHAEHGGTLNEHQLNRLHAILKPFMLRRVKKDVVSELTTKTEITVHCKLSSRQKAFYRAIKDKISLSEIFDSRRGSLNDIKIMNLMNIVIQLRKVCNHPELFERNEGTSYLYFGEIPNSLLPASFGDLEDVCYSGGKNPITYKIPKLVYNEILRDTSRSSSSEQHGVSRETFEKLFNIFSPKNVYGSMFPEGKSTGWSSNSTGTFGFAHLIDLSPSEVSFLASGSFMERLLFSIMRWDRQFMTDALDLFNEIEEELDCSQPEKEKVRAVTRMLLLPTKSQISLLSDRLSTGLGDEPLEALVMSNQDRFLSNVRLLHAAHSFIPRARAPPINAHCSDRNFAYQMLEELHDPWTKRVLVGFARTSDCNGPRKPNGSPHPLIEEIDSELPVSQPVMQLTYKIFGSCPPMQSFDPARMLTDSGKLQTLDIMLKRLRAGNHRVLLFAQMTKMLNIIEDYMNYRKYRYLRLDGSSTIMDRRDMVRDFQHRNDIFVFLLSTRAGGLGINLTAADTVIFYESDWNPTLDLQAMDRAHRLGQTKDVTVYRLICKETVEEKILQRASQKNTVQQLVMTGGHVQGDLLAPEDVVSLLIDDAQLEQKLKEIPLQVRDRQKRKGGAKGIRIDAEGDASLEDITADGGQANGPEASATPDQATPSNSSKKRKAATDKQTNHKPRSHKSQRNGDSAPTGSRPTDHEVGEDTIPSTQQQRTKRPKRATKSVNETLEPASTA